MSRTTRVMSHNSLQRLHTFLVTTFKINLNTAYKDDTRMPETTESLLYKKKPKQILK